MWARSRQTIVCLSNASAVCRAARLVVTSPTTLGRSITTREQNELLLWLSRREEHEAYSAVSIGMSKHGRGLFASRPIRAGGRILRVSRNLIITSDKLHPKVKHLLSENVSNWARLALFILAEQHAGQASEWYPYISCLPWIGTLHNTALWCDTELEMIRQSTVLYRETLQSRKIILDQFADVEHVVKQCPDIFGYNVTSAGFQHAYAIVNSRAWGVDPQGSTGLVPFADFLNHDANCDSFLSFDNNYAYAEIIADRHYAVGDEVVINYGRFGNDNLVVTFGFALTHNPFDQVEVWMGLPKSDALRKEKVQLLDAHGMTGIAIPDDYDCDGYTFLIKEVKSATGHGKGIPQSLRAFSRVLSLSSTRELVELAKEAAEHDGRLAWRPLKNKHRELQAAVLLLTRVEALSQARASSLVTLQLAEYHKIQSPILPVRREIAETVLWGELRVLRSAAKWLKHAWSTINDAL